MTGPFTASPQESGMHMAEQLCRAITAYKSALPFVAITQANTYKGIFKISCQWIGQTTDQCMCAPQEVLSMTGELIASPPSSGKVEVRHSGNLEVGWTTGIRDHENIVVVSQMPAGYNRLIAALAMYVVRGGYITLIGKSIRTYEDGYFWRVFAASSSGLEKYLVGAIGAKSEPAGESFSGRVIPQSNVWVEGPDKVRFGVRIYERLA